MIAANEAVARLLASRRREALFRVHERPDPQAIELLLKKLADLDVPTPPAPEQLTPASRRRGRRGERAGDGLTTPSSGARPRGVPRARPALAEAGALRPGESRPLRPREPCLLPLHLADPALSGPRRPPGAAAGARPLRRSGGRGSRRPRGAHVGARARSRPGRVPRRRALPRLAARATCCSSAAGTSPSRARSSGRSARASSSASATCSRATCPARRLPGDYFELNPTSAPRWSAAAEAAPTGSETAIDVLVEKIEKAEGKVELSHLRRRKP